MNIIIILGPQGSGKSTQANMLAQKYQFPIFVAGDQLRQFAQKDHPDSLQVKELLSQGKLVPNEVLFNLIEEFLRLNSQHHTFIFDGFPRSLDQCLFIEKLTKVSSYQITAVLIDISTEESFKRLRLRSQQNNSDRDDDKPAIIRQRLDLYQQETLPVLDYLETRFRLIRINGERAIEPIFEDMVNQLKKYHVIR